MEQSLPVIHGLKEHIRDFMLLLQRISALVEHENKILLYVGQEHLVLGNTQLQDVKQRLYVKFDRYARIIQGCIREGHVTDKELTVELNVHLAVFRSTVQANNTLLEHYMIRHQRLLDRIMQVAEIDDSDLKGDSYVSEFSA